MRTFEILLLIALGIVIFTLFTELVKRPHRLKILGLTSVLILLHLTLEGCRWQMIPNYLVFLILIVSVLLPKSSFKFLNVLRNLFLIFLLLLGSFLSIALPVLKFSNDGELPVGVDKIQIVDLERDEIMTVENGDRRDFPVRIFYPTSQEKTENVQYIPDFETIKYSYEKKLGWPPFLLNYLGLFEIEATANANVDVSKKLPLVIYSHGLTNNYTESGGRLMKIASKGYVVAAINHSYSSDYSVLSDGSIANYKALSQLGDPIEKVDSVKTIIANQWVDDVQSLIEHLKTTEYSDAIDFKTVGLIGFSAGGTMATLGSYKIENVKAAINLDGTPRGINMNETPTSPQLFMFSEPEQYSDQQIEAWGIDRKMIEGPLRLIRERSEKVLNIAPKKSYVIKIPGSRHANFNEYALISPLNYKLGIGGPIDSWKCYEMINEMIFAFLDRNLKNNEVDFPVYNSNEVISN